METTTSNSMELDAISIFPEEIWQRIFDMVADYKDLQHLTKTCLLFNKILHPSKPAFLFPQAFPHLLTHLTGNEILNCRSVSRTWNSGVDSTLEEDPSRRPHSLDDEDDKKWDPRKVPFANIMAEKGLGFAYKFGQNNIPKYPKWVTETWLFYEGLGFQNDSRNPFIGRSLQIELLFCGRRAWQIAEEEQYLSRLRAFLEQYGKHIWYLTLTSHLWIPGEWMERNVIPFLHSEIFQLVPQLRQLRLLGSCGENPIQELLPFPSAPNLESLEIEEIASPTPHPYYSALLSNYHLQLKKLHIQSWMEFQHLEWPNLQELHLMDLNRMGNDFWSLLGLISKAPRLSKLGISGHRWTASQEPGTSFLGLLDVIAPLARSLPSLTVLRIQGDFLPHSDPFSEETSTLPISTNSVFPLSVKTLELEYISGKSYDFLRRFPLLKNLNIFCKGGRHVGLAAFLQVGLQNTGDILLGDVSSGYDAFVESVHRSVNIWKVLPQLEVLTLQRNVYSREVVVNHSKRGAEM